MRSVSISLLLCVCALFTSNSFAHKMKAAYTIVLFNERTGYLEVMHRFTLHDAEEAAWFLFDKNADIIAKDETQAQFAQYVVTQFSLKTQPKQPLELELVGYQNDEGFFWVYQEAPLPSNITHLTIRHDALREVWSEQINTVNVEGKGVVQSVSFSDADLWHTLLLKPE